MIKKTKKWYRRNFFQFCFLGDIKGQKKKILRRGKVEKKKS